ncbi:MAG: NADH-quinone oxidoreductase subunit J [Balneolales bacterium]|nr:NADH-quinone oxidoreductase subunit J [Balneolales bacterium]
METFFFVFIATFAIGTALAMVFSRNTVNSALFLILHMLSISGFYLSLNAQFLAVIQILVYAGAIMVLFLFVIMVLNMDEDETIFSQVDFKQIFAFLLAIVVFAQLIYIGGEFTGTLPDVSTQEMMAVGTVEAIGDELFTTFLLPFEATAILLTAAVVGAMLLAQQNINVEDEN